LSGNESPEKEEVKGGSIRMPLSFKECIEQSLEDESPSVGKDKSQRGSSKQKFTYYSILK
jgi:hypothetical protein